jgi:hypothetical protein
MEQRKGRIVESPVEARQGFLGRPVLVVLVVSCTLAIVAPALSFRWHFRARFISNRGSLHMTREALMTSDQSEEELFIAPARFGATYPQRFSICSLM